MSLHLGGLCLICMLIKYSWVPLICEGLCYSRGYKNKLNGGSHEKKNVVLFFYELSWNISLNFLLSWGWGGIVILGAREEIKDPNFRKYKFGRYLPGLWTRSWGLPWNLCPRLEGPQKVNEKRLHRRSVKLEKCGVWKSVATKSRGKRCYKQKGPYQPPVGTPRFH